MRIGFVGGSYSARSTAIADEECINFFAETVESQGTIVPSKAYGGQTASTIRNYFGTPGIAVFATCAQGPTRAQINANGTLYVVSGGELYSVSSSGSTTPLGAIANDGNAATMAFNSLQILIVAAGQAYCYTLSTGALLNVTSQLQGLPIKVEESDTYFIVQLSGNKFQMSQVLDGTTWPGQLVNEVSVFPDNIVSICMNHRELWVFGLMRTQPYQDTGSTEVFDAIPGAMIEMGCGATFSPVRLDNSIFWIDQNERGGRSAWRSNGYTPTRISVHAVEYDLSSYGSIAGIVSYAMQFQGHLWWVIYIPGASWTWVYDVGEGLWFKMAAWVGSAYQAHWGWNHSYTYGQHIIGDWNSGNLYTLDMKNFTDNGNTIRRLRRTPTISDEMSRMYHAELTIDFDTGLGPQPPLTDGEGNPRPPQAMLRWSDTRGKTWSNEHIAGCGLAGQFKTRVIWRRLGKSRYRVYELSVTDPIQWSIVDAYLRLGTSSAVK